MTNDVEQASQEFAPEVVQSEAVEVEAVDAPESTQGQDETQPATEAPDTGEAEDKSPSKQRRERRNAYVEQLRTEKQAAETELLQYKERESRIQDAAKQNAPPAEADFTDYNEYLMSISAWQAGQQFDQRQIAEIQRETSAKEAEVARINAKQQEEVRQEWVAQVAEAKTRYADFDQVALSQDVAVTEQMAGMIQSSEVGADLAYHLGMNRGLAAEIASLPPIEQAMALGRLEASVQRPKPRTQSAAPDPIDPVRAKATTSKDPADMSADEYSKWRANGGTITL